MLRVSVVVMSAVVLLSLGCYSAPVMPPGGFIYQNTEAPISPAVAGRPVGTRTGEASAWSVLGLFAGGDASVEAAVRDGGISEPRHLDYRFFNFLGIYQNFTTIVRGE